MEVASIFIGKILAEAANRGAMSLHLSIGSQPRIRVDNGLLALESENIIDQEIMSGIINFVLSEEDVARLNSDREIVTVKEFSGNLRFRINAFYQKDLPSLSYHFIPGAILNFKELGLPETVSAITGLESGLFIIAGPFGSGKTTTAAAFLEEINKNSNKYVITLENPIEYLFVNKSSVIDQRQIGRDVHTIIDGLDYCMNEDVDVLYVAEIKKDFNAAIPLVLSLAAGNSLVLLEINADNSISAIEKILTAAAGTSSREAARYNLADVLSGVVVQKLLPQRGGGPVLAHEVLLVNSAVRSLIREGKLFQIESIIQNSRREGMASMSKSVEDLAQAGKINRDNIY